MLRGQAGGCPQGDFFIRQLRPDTGSRTRVGMKYPGKKTGKSKILDPEAPSWDPALRKGKRYS